MIYQLAIMTQVVRQYFSELENWTLTELVDKYKNTEQNKRYDYKVIKQKNEKWESESEEFNSQSGLNNRESKQLKKC